MQKKVEHFIRAATDIYCLLMFVLLPLYMRYGFAMIGDVKYQLFRNATILFGILLSLLQLIWYISGGRKESVRHVSLTDSFMLGYLTAAVIAFCLSVEHFTAFWGFPGWYMGLLSQLLFVWEYFALSRWSDSMEKAVQWIPKERPPMPPRS